MKKVLLLLFLAGLAHAQPWLNIIATSRATDWSKAGVVGGIPTGSWSQCGSTIQPGNGAAKATEINNAIAACSSFHYVQLAIGVFNLPTGLLFNSTHNIAIRGQGANLTALLFSGDQPCQGFFAVACFVSSDQNYQGGPSNLATWSAGYAKGATTITLATVPNLAVGKAIMLDQTDDGSDDSSIFICYTRGGILCSINGDSGGGPRPNRSQQQMVTVTSITGAGPFSVGITPALVMPNWSGSKTPQAWWATNPILSSGIEDMSLNVGTSGANAGVAIFNCTSCWVKGVSTLGPFARSAVEIFQSNHVTVRDNYFYKTPDSASVNYGVEEIPCSDCLVENNIFQQVQAPYPANGSCTGCVFGYNFDVNNVFTGGTFQNQSGFPHAVGDENMLYEGNIGSGIYSDNFHGSHHFQTIFRNYWNGYQKNEGNFTTSATTPIILANYSRFYNIVGNVLGNCARQTIYQSAVGDVHPGSVIYEIGFGQTLPPTVPDDIHTVTTLMRWGNYDCVTNTNRFVAGEVPSGLAGAQAPFANPVPASQVLPPSFYLPSKPAWWKSTNPWPGIGPDVVGGNLKYCTGGGQTGTYVLTAGQCTGSASTLSGGRIYSNPAMECYLNVMGGTPDGTGPPLAFNANQCYYAVANTCN